MKIKKSLPDVIISIIVLIWLGTLYAQIPAIPEISKPYPLALIVIATVMTLFLLIKNLLRMKNGEEVETRAPEQTKIMIPYCLMIIAYIWLLNKIGYIIATIVFMIASLMFLKFKNKVLMIVISVIVTCILYYIFTNFLVVVLPKGRWINFTF